MPPEPAVFFSRQSAQVKSLEELLHPYSPPETTLVDRLRYWRSAKPDSVAFRFLGDGSKVTESITFSQLDERVRACAARLISLGLRGQRALLMYPSSIEFIVAFFGCQYAGVTAVPAYPPRRNRNMGRINTIADDASTAIALTTREVINRRDRMTVDNGTLLEREWLATEEIPVEMASDWNHPGIYPDDLAIIQYTSGSTGSPKGVMLSHHNVLANCRYIATAFQIRDHYRGVSWLPFYHDMGLIGGLITSFFVGGECSTMSPTHFIAKPIRWLKAISTLSADVSGGPNFAYAHCCEKISDEACQGLDLSHWKVAFNGAEPIRPDILERFTRKFAPWGFRHEAHYPCYGMAETTLIVTGGNPEKPPVIETFDAEELTRHRVKPIPPVAENVKRMVGCGQLLQDEELAIVDPEKLAALPDDKIGEIWVRSESVGQGYWQKQQETRETFRAELADQPGKHFLRTGDLGFMHDGELYVTGRLKDMIIVRGVNRYPQDIEATAEECHRKIRAGGSAAFAVDHWDRERLVIVSEVDRSQDADWDDIIQNVRAAVIAQHDLPPDEIILVRAGSTPKTSSGKVQRHACRNKYMDEDLLVVARWSAEQAITPPAAPTPDHGREAVSLTSRPEVIGIVERFVREVARERARHLTPDTNIVVDLGLDSLERLQIANSLEEHFGGRFPDEVLQEIETIGEVAAAVEEHIGLDRNGRPARPVQAADVSREIFQGEVPERYYRIEQMPEYLRFERLKTLMANSGIRNPYFSVHEGRIADTTVVEGRKLISYASYNYLSMSGDPDVNQSAVAAVEEFGTSVSASRLVSGEKTIHRVFEQELAEFLGVEEVMTMAGGHATNESVIGHLVGPGDLILHDALAHNSIIQGAELSGARRRPFPHNDWQALDETLAEIRNQYHKVLVAVEGLYSMDGDYPQLDKFVEIRKKHRVWLYVDEAHSFGTMGKTGRGIGELFHVDRNDVDMWMGTLSKSFGSAGGFIAGSKALIEYLRYTTPGYVFAAGLPPAQVGAALGALRKLRAEPERVTRLQEISALFLRLAREAGLDTGLSKDSPIIPVITGNSLLALRLSEALFQNGINAQPILHPAVDEDKTRIRFFMTSSHTPEQVQYTIDTLAREWQHLTSTRQAMSSWAEEGQGNPSVR
jgi:acyl carrier protein